MERVRIAFRTFFMTLSDEWVVFAWRDGAELHLPCADIFRITAEPSGVRFEGAFQSVARALSFSIDFLRVEANEICRVLTEELGFRANFATPRRKRSVAKPTWTASGCGFGCVYGASICRYMLR